MTNTNMSDAPANYDVTTPRQAIGYELTLALFDVTEDEWKDIEDQILQVVCDGHGDGDDHVCRRDEWVATTKPIYEDDQ